MYLYIDIQIKYTATCVVLIQVLSMSSSRAHIYKYIYIYILIKLPQPHRLYHRLDLTVYRLYRLHPHHLQWAVQQNKVISPSKFRKKMLSNVQK
jgi:hypothetical protein